MKAKKVVAALVGTALVATTAASFAGCGQKKANLNISDYTIEYTEVNKVKEGYTSLRDLISYTSGNDYGDYVIITNNSGDVTTYSVYSKEYERTVVSNQKNTPSTFSLYNYGTGIRVVNPDNSYTDNGMQMNYSTYTVYAPNGNVLISGVSQLDSATHFTGYLNGSNEESDILVLSGTTKKPNEDRNKANTVRKYYEVKQDKETERYSYTEINVSNIRFYSSEYNQGETNNGLTQKLYQYDEEKPVEGDLLEYSVSRVGYTAEFYKSNVKTGTVDLTNATIVGYVGTNVYYSVEIPVDSNEKSKYNYMEISDGIQAKYNYTLYKYDLAKNKTTEVKYDGKVERVLPYYNYTLKTYDAAVVVGSKFIDGVAYEDLSSFAYITDANLNVAYDITDLLIGVSSSGNIGQIYKLNDDNYLIGSYIVDKDLKVVNRGSGIYGEGVVSFYVNGYYGLKDLSGRIITEPKYSNPVFYGGNALVRELQADGTEEYVILSTTGNVTNVNLADDEVLTNYSGFYIIRKTTQDRLTGNNIVTNTVYSYSGTMLKAFTNSATVTHNLNVSGKYITDTVYTNENGNYTTNTAVYKVA